MKNLPKLFRHVEEIREDEQWCTREKACVLAAMVVSLRAKLVVEIGVWRGGSLLPMALAMQSLGRGRVVGIDPWSAKASIEGQNETNAKWWGGVSHEESYQFFNERITELGLGNIVTTLRSSSDDVDIGANGLEQIDIWHCDGNHSIQAFHDVCKYAPLIRVGGIAIMDDVGWEGGGVDAGVEKLISFGFSPLYKLETGIVFQRVRSPSL